MNHFCTIKNYAITTWNYATDQNFHESYAQQEFSAQQNNDVNPP